MKALIVGGGSIGSRHLRNLRALGIGSLGLVEISADRRQALGAESGAISFSRLDAGLDWGPDFVVIATPSHLHVEQALAVVKRGFDVFVEKPLAHAGAGLTELSALVKSKRVISIVGCNMRFHPGPAKVKELLDQGSIGKILFARFQFGYYLPDWRPGVDYRANYAAREDSGGGCILDGIHEIDLARWMLGEIEQVTCFASRVSSLEIETEDVAAILCRHENAAISEIHLDYVQRSYQRSCQVAGERGTIFWDFNERRVRWYDSPSGQWTNFEQPGEWQLNDMYVDEVEHFLACVRDRAPTMLPIEDAVGLMRATFAAKESARRASPVWAATGSAV
jgi:predicted dehydrogenase